MIKEGQEVCLLVDFHIEDEYEELTGEIIPAGTIGMISEILDQGEDWIDYLVLFETYGHFEMTDDIFMAI